MPAIHLENICLSKITDNGQPVDILRNICLTANSSRITAVIGPSGGGKSSLIRLINRMSEPTSGSIFLNGTDIFTIDPVDLRRQVAMVLQKPFMFEGSVQSNLLLPFSYINSKATSDKKSRIEKTMEQTRLSPALLERNARSLSLGEQQRVNIARALITEPCVLLLDEPTSALDRPTADGLAATVKDICQNSMLAVILVTHDLRLAERVADYIYFLDSGVIKEGGLAMDILKQPHCPELIRFLEDPEPLEG
jgi:putative ABC transport system ATP-binding protein